MKVYYTIQERQWSSDVVERVTETIGAKGKKHLKKDVVMMPGVSYKIGSKLAQQVCDWMNYRANIYKTDPKQLKRIRRKEAFKKCKLMYDRIILNFLMTKDETYEAMRREFIKQKLIANGTIRN